MANEKLPSYLASAKPVPKSARAPGLMTTGAAFAGIYLWIAYYSDLGNCLSLGSLGGAILGVVIGGGLSFLLYYLVSGMWGMRRGLPLYILGSSTFGTKGAYFLPGIFMGILQIGWYSVATYFSTQLVLDGIGGLFGRDIAADPVAKTLWGPDGAGEFSILFAVVAIVWGYLFAFIGAKGIKHVARMANIFPIVPIVMLLGGAMWVVLKGGLGKYTASASAASFPPVAAMMLAIQMVIGFGATALAAGADFTQNNRNAKDVTVGGMAGIWGAAVFVGVLGLITVAGANGLKDLGGDLRYATALGSLGEFIPKIMMILFAIGSIAPACFCCFIMGNSLSTMIPSVPRMTWTLGGATIGIILAMTGVAGNLGAFFGLIGASFGPVCGAMAADYLLTAGKWAGPRKGVNATTAGYAAWGVGFLVGILNHPWVGVLPGWHATALYSFVAGFIVYLWLGRAAPKLETEEAYTVVEPPEE